LSRLSGIDSFVCRFDGLPPCDIDLALIGHEVCFETPRFLGQAVDDGHAPWQFSRQRSLPVSVTHTVTDELERAYQ
jgi:hypothetical protein